MKISTNNFVKRQTKESRFAYFDGSWGALVEIVEKNFDKHKKGYRDGVILVPVPVDNFYSSVIKMGNGISASVVFEPRMQGEDPVISIVAKGYNKSPAKYVEIVLSLQN